MNDEYQVGKGKRRMKGQRKSHLNKVVEEEQEKAEEVHGEYKEEKEYHE